MGAPGPFCVRVYLFFLKNCRFRAANAIKSYKDLNTADYRITSKLGTTGEMVAKKLIAKAKYHGYDNEQQAMLDVVNGKADAFIYDAPYNVVAVNKVGNGKRVFLDKPFTFEPLAFGLKKGDYDSINFINNFLPQIHEDGTYDRIHDKWFKSTEWLKDMSREFAGIAALSLFTGAYVAEIIRSGVQSIARGQNEAVRSLGLSAGQSMRHVVLPQAFKRVLPPLAGQFISLVRDTSLVSVIAMTELLKSGREVITTSFSPFEILFCVAGLYLLINLPLSKIASRLERRLAQSD